MSALEALALARSTSASPAIEQAVESAKRRLLAQGSPVADVRAVGPSRRGRTLAVHLDVLRSPDGLVRPGAIEWLEQAVERLDVAILTGVVLEGAAETHRLWLRQAGLSGHAAGRIRFPVHKPPSNVYLGTRVMRFEGCFPDALQLRAMLALSQ